MKTYILVLAILATLIVSVSASANAQVIPGPLGEGTDALPPGLDVLVTLKSGDQIQGALGNSGPEAPRVADERGTERKTQVVGQAKNTDSPDDNSALAWFVVRVLPKGAKVKVNPYNGPGVRGQVVDVTEDSITLSSKKGESVFARSEIKSVKVPSTVHRVLWGTIGAAAGFFVAGYYFTLIPAPGAYWFWGGTTALGSIPFFFPHYRTIYKGPISSP